MTTSSVSKLNERNRIHHLPIKTEFENIIRCPICSDIPFPPIYNCENGHIICHVCFQRLRHCGICRSSYENEDKNGRNFPLEEIINGSTFHCKYSKLGCQEVILGSNMTTHFNVCQFNPFFVLCNDKLETPCENNRIASSQYLEHLRTQHGVPKGGVDRVTYSFVQRDDSTGFGETINTDYFEQEGQIFLQRWEFQNGFYFTWICILNLAGVRLDDWIAEVKIRAATEEFDEDSAGESQHHFSATLTLHDSCKTLAEVKATGSFLCLHHSQILAFGGSEVETFDDLTWDYYWSSEVRVNRKILNQLDVENTMSDGGNTASLGIDSTE